MNTSLLLLLLEAAALHIGPQAGIDATPQLGAQRWSVRDAAAKALTKTWPYSLPTLLVTAKSSDVEASERAKAIIVACRAKTLRDAGRAPWADWPTWSAERRCWQPESCPPLTRAIRRGLERQQIESYVGMPTFYPYSLLTERWAADAIGAGVPGSIIRLWFVVGSAVDKQYGGAQINYRTYQYEWNRMPCGVEMKP